MLLANKIKESEECIDNKSLGFRTFLESLRQGRCSFVSFPHRPSQSINESEPLPDHEHSSEANRSEILHFQRLQNEQQRPSASLSSGFTSKPAEGDKAIRNKLRVGVANRQRANCFRLPSYCFEQTKVDLGEHLREVKKDAPKVIMEVTSRRGGRAQKEEQFSVLMEQKGLTGEDKQKSISGLNPNIVLKYCIIHQINSISSLKEILIFFTRLLELLDFPLSEPKIEKYKNCVYFGQPIRKNQIYEGIVYYYSGVVYFGQLFNNQRHGLGAEVDLNKNSIYKGEFRNGDMVGFFQVHKDGQKYFGELKQGKYHGRGKLIDGDGAFQGDFKDGRKVYGSTRRQTNKKDLSSSRADRRQTPYWSTQKQLNLSRTEHFEFSKNKIRPIRQHNRSSNMQLDSTYERKKPSKRYAEQTRQFSYPFNHEIQGNYNPEINQMINSKRNSRVASLRIREVGKLHSIRRPQPEEDEERPLMNKF